MEEGASVRFGTKYRLLESIGRGGFATVYRAIDETLDRQLAIKVLDSLQVREPGFLERFYLEARLAAKLNHPNIVAIYEVGEYDNQHFIAMQYLPGPSLARLIQQQGAMPCEQVLRFAEQLASALDYAHLLGCVHRDVKPGNVMLDEHGNAVLMDFGIAKAVGESGSLTRAGIMIGTPQYMAPEQWTTGEADARSDLYSLGIMLYQMLTGRLPFEGQPTRIMYAHVHEAPPPLRSLNPALPAEVEAVFAKALAKDPAQRYQTGEQLVADLRAALTAKPTGIAETQIRKTPTGEKQATSRVGHAAAGWLLLAMGAVLVVIVGVLVWWLVSGQPALFVPSGGPETATPVAAASPMAGTTSYPTGQTQPIIATITPSRSPTTRLQPTPETPATPLTLLAPLDGEVLPAGADVSLRWQWRSSGLEPGQRYRVAIRPELGSPRDYTTDRPELQLSGLEAGSYTWLVLIEEQRAEVWQEVDRSRQWTFSLRPPVSPTPVATPSLVPVPLSPVQTATSTASASPTLVLTPAASVTPAGRALATPTASPTRSAGTQASLTPEAVRSPAVRIVPEPTEAGFVRLPTVSLTPTLKAVASVTPLPTPSPGVTRTPTPTRTGTPTPTASPTLSLTPSPTRVPSVTPTVPSGVGDVIGPSGKLAFALTQDDGSRKVYIVQMSATPSLSRNTLLNAGQPAFSPDGQRLLVVGEQLERRIVFASTIQKRAAVTCHRFDSWHPSWSPDGKSFVFEGLAQEVVPVPALYVQPIDEPEPCALLTRGLRINGVVIAAADGSQQLSPVWGPDRRIYFHGDDHQWTGGVGTRGLWSVKPESNEPARLWVADPGALPTAADALHVLYQSNTGGHWDIFALDLRSGAAQNVTAERSDDAFWGALSPDGSAVAFVARAGNLWAIWLAALDGRQARPLLSIAPEWGRIDPGDMAEGRMSWSR